jgi:DNA-binding response OmpR family regulator
MSKLGTGTLLIIDDDAELVELVREYMSSHGWVVQSAETPKRGIQMIREKSPRLVILDVMLPEKDGFEVCREIRRFSEVPIIMLTARGELTDRVVGLEVGADDYLSKPFAARELLARIQTILRRQSRLVMAAEETPPLRFHKIKIDLYGRSVHNEQQLVDLTTAEFDVLALLAQHPGKVFTREQIMDEVKGVDWQAFNRTIDVLISRIRTKLGDNSKRPRYIKTIWGAGYVFVGKAGGEE